MNISQSTVAQIQAVLIGQMWLAQRRKKETRNLVLVNYHIGYQRAISDIASELSRKGIPITVPEPASL